MIVKKIKKKVIYTAELIGYNYSEGVYNAFF